MDLNQLSAAEMKAKFARECGQLSKLEIIHVMAKLHNQILEASKEERSLSEPVFKPALTVIK